MNKEDTEEVVQDCLIAAIRGLANFKNESTLKTWIYSIAINKSKDRLKHRSRLKRSGHVMEIDENSAVDYFHPGLMLESKEEVEVMMEGINRLAENQKTALILAKFDHKSQKEIAEIMGSTPKAVESLLGRAKTNFKKYLNNI